MATALSVVKDGQLVFHLHRLEASLSPQAIPLLTPPPRVLKSDNSMYTKYIIFILYDFSHVGRREHRHPAISVPVTDD